MQKFKTFKNQFTNWVINNSSIKAAGIIGSYARENQNLDSDIDIIILTNSPKNFIDNKQWVNNFGKTNKIKTENWGKVTSLRCFYDSGTEIEFSIASLSWASIPIDKGTHHVISNGIVVLHDPDKILKKLIETINSN